MATETNKREFCTCHGVVHKLLENSDGCALICTNCGNIYCEAQGYGSCLYCGSTNNNLNNKKAPQNENPPLFHDQFLLDSNNKQPLGPEKRMHGIDKAIAVPTAADSNTNFKSKNLNNRSNDVKNGERKTYAFSEVMDEARKNGVCVTRESAKPVTKAEILNYDMAVTFRNNLLNNVIDAETEENEIIDDRQDYYAGELY